MKIGEDFLLNLDHLDPTQREAVTYGDGPLLVLAGAGSGKTRVLTHRIAWLIERGVNPSQCLAITFTNKAAAEMKERIAHLVGPAARAIWVSTFHSACVRILRRDIERFGYRKSFVILDSSDQLAVVKDCLKQLNISDKQLQPSGVLGAISKAKNELLGPDAYARAARDYFQQQAATVFRLYQERLKANSAVDFDDLIMLTVQMLESYPDLLEHYQERFRYILVDEYQDTNEAQYRLVRMLAERHRNLTVVGDDDQGIYSWRGATVRNILNFEADYPDAHVVTLGTNYRSTGHIVSAAYAVVRHNAGRKEKRVTAQAGPGARVKRYQATDEHDEGWFIAGEIERFCREGIGGLGLTYRDFAVLYRTHAQSRALEEIFVRKGIPYGIVGGLKFFERKEIKDVLAYLRLLANPADTLSFTRAIGVPKRGIGPATVDKLLEYAAGRGRPIAEVALSPDEVPGLGAGFREKIASFGRLVNDLRRQVPFLPLSDLVEQVCTQSGILNELKAENSIESLGRIENLAELKSVALEFEEPTGEENEGLSPLDAFLANAALVSDADQDTGGEDRVVMMTLHTAKGLEFPVVFLVGMEEGVFPHSRSLYEEQEMEEERRLCYVGMTRARLRLYQTGALSRTLYGQTGYNLPSRFWEETPAEHVEQVGPVRQAAVQTVRRRPQEEDDFSPAIGSPGWGNRLRTGWAGQGQGAGVSGAAAPETESAPPDLKPGDAVSHPKFGQGSVKEVRGDTATITFPGVGEKTLVAFYLKKI
jgi:DNA helicase II / ATP-dependent DNA helicase PcrA